MKLEIKGKQVNLGDAFTSHIRNELTGLTDKYFGDPISADVTVSRDGHLYITHLMMRMGHGLRFEATGKASAPYPAFENALERISKQLRRQKRKLVNKGRTSRGNTSSEDMSISLQTRSLAQEELANADPVSVVVAELDSMIESLPIRDAILRLESNNSPALLFMNIDQGDALNMIYRRPDGHIGWVDPAASLPSMTGASEAFQGAHPTH